jgi:hypothetical protein
VCLGVEPTLGLVTRYCFLCEVFCLKVAVLSLWGALSDERMGLQFAVQWSESRRTRNHTLLSHLRLPQPGGPGSRIYIPQEHGGPVIPPGIGFLSRRLLRFKGYGGGILTLLHTEGRRACLRTFMYTVKHTAELLVICFRTVPRHE